ncbi:protein-glutamate O-methyltransferase CheR [Sporomusa aerivorans]|uniref:CheR family methyltransferase n=1 Tax=Sporomusa aerivorans TaxID=204936 RepID=UPI00352B9067
MLQITTEEFDKLAQYIYRYCGIKLGQGKKTLILGRLGNKLKKNGFTSFSDYYDYVVADRTGGETAALIDAITTNHTYFMREAEHFEYFVKVVLPFLTKTLREKDIRIWSAGCSTGNEPYTLAMMIDEYFGVQKVNWDARLLATDISEQALAIARRGLYGPKEIALLPRRWLMPYFTKLPNGSYCLQEKIKSEIIFRRFNLMEERFPFKKKFHCIFCRNVMIYFDRKTRENLVRKFYEATADNGYLFISHSESLDRDTAQYTYIRPGIYRKERKQ